MRRPLRTSRLGLGHIGWLLVSLVVGIPLGGLAFVDNPSAVVGSKHDLSVGGSGPVTSSQPDACIFCHASHLPGGSSGSVNPLWNREIPAVTYRLNEKPTAPAGMGNPSIGRSKLCLSCHDGTIAPGQTVSRGLIRTTGSPRPGMLLGTDLSADHPVGVQPMDNGELVLSLFTNPPRSADPAIRLFDGNVECTSCHTPHQPDVDSIAGKFLVRPNSEGVLCLACHDPNRPHGNTLSGWSVSAHATAGNTVPTDSNVGLYGSVRANACLSCHRPHRGEGRGVAQIVGAEEEAACESCHKGSNVSPAIRDVMRDFSKTYAHPTTMLAGLHAPGEDTFPLSSNRHAECGDCHQPHSAQSGGITAVPPAVQPALIGVSGFDGSGPLKPASSEYEVCFKCHADSRNKPQDASGYSAYGYSPFRQAEQNVIDPMNLRESLASSIARHNVTQPRHLSDAEVPSLRPFILNPDGSRGRALGVGTYIYCTDCHASNEARRMGGSGANGPHGSTNPHILASRYEQEVPPALRGTGDGQGTGYVPGAGGSAALCNLCHEVEGSILQGRSFTQHRRHIVQGRTSCVTCHEPHGIQDAGGNLTNNRSLVSFDLNIVGPDSSNRLYFDGGSRECYLTCHGVEHAPKTY